MQYIIVFINGFNCPKCFIILHIAQSIAFFCRGKYCILFVANIFFSVVSRQFVSYQTLYDFESVTLQDKSLFRFMQDSVIFTVFIEFFSLQIITSRQYSLVVKFIDCHENFCVFKKRLQKTCNISARQRSVLT